MNWRTKIYKLVVVSALFSLAAFPALDAEALTLDWSGYFRATHDLVYDYQMNKAEPGYSNMGGQGEDIPGQGTHNATYTTMFLKLKPRVLVNDNIIVNSEWNVGDPVSGFFGRNIPDADRNNFLSTGKDAMSISASRLWLDVHSDFGTVQVGRAPMAWGLGIVFNAGDGPFDRFQSTSDTIRLLSKFGYLSLMPLYSKVAMGSSLSGTRDPLAGSVVAGDDDVTDYGVALRYENPEEDLDAGAMFYKRSASDSQTSFYAPAGSTTYTAGANGMNLRLFDFFVKKTWNHFGLAAELPLWSGEIGDINKVGSRNTYKATALALEASLKFETWRHTLKAGTAPGQAPTTTGNRTSTFSAFQFHRAYKLGMILFNYNLGNFGNTNPDAVPNAAGGYNTSRTVSPYDSAITNAKYLMLSSEKHWEQWGMNFGLVWAQANQSAQAGLDAYNHRTSQWYTSVGNQSKNMGIEADFGTTYNWDNNISIGVDMGMLFPGDYFRFVNSPINQSPANTVSALSVTAATVF
ncbi:MAG: hypothetical protein ACXVB9_20235 [Bdellovibrionota bacterium]